MIFVFGSNQAGIHGAGAARYALNHEGAIIGIGFGLMGNSFAIPTKDFNIKPLSLFEIKTYVDQFIEFARSTPEFEYKVTRIGCGLAGFKDRDIAPMFLDAPDNCNFDTVWREFLSEDRNYWGSY